MKLATVKRQVEAVVAKDPRFPPSHLIWKRMIILNRVHEIVKKQSGPLSFFSSWVFNFLSLFLFDLFRPDESR